MFTALVSLLFASSAFAAQPYFQPENLAGDLASRKPTIEANITFSDDSDPFPDGGVDFILPSRLLRSIPVARVTKQDADNQCRILAVRQVRQNVVIRVSTNLSWDDEGCYVTIWAQTQSGRKIIQYQIQQIGS